MKKINIFPWDENFNTGLKTVDEQHQKLVDIINRLATKFSFEPESIELSTVFDELIAYTHYHFETEEAIWASHLDDKSILHHHDAHKNFIDEVKSLIEKQKGNTIEITAENTLNFLVKWLVTHILESDRYLAYRVAAIQSGASVDESVGIAREKMSGHTREMIDIIIRIYDSLSHTTLRLMREIDKQHKIKQTLKSKEKLLRTVIDEIPDLLVLKDHKGNFLLANKMVADLYGTTPEAMEGKANDYFGVSKEIANFFGKNLLSIMHSGKTEIVYEDSLDAITGETRHYKSIKKPFKDIKGNNQILIIAHDITEQIKKEDRLNYAMLGSSDGLWDWNMETNEVYYSPRWYGMLGYQSGELPKTVETWEKLVHPDDIKNAWKIIEQYKNNKINKFEIEFRMRHKHGHWVHILSRAQFVKNRDGTIRKPLRLVGTHVDVTERWKHQQELLHLAHYDSLTNLPNRVLLVDRLEQAIIQSQRHGSEITVLYLDLDGFKEVNDVYGHDVGDALLLKISSRLKQSLRMEDTLSRFGGDEFVAVIQSFDGTVSILQVLERLLESASAPITVEDIILHVSASIGVTFYPQADTVTPNQLVRQADQAMYMAKQLGKNRYHIFDSHQDHMIRNKQESIEEIRDALKHHEFVMYYQPKVNMHTGEIIGFEALIRWKHPEKGLLLPMDFLPIIENDALIVEIGDRVFEEVLNQMEYWHKLDIIVSTSINVSAGQLAQNDFVDKLEFLLKKHPNIDPANLELEILETSALEQIAYVEDVMKQCQDLGVSFSLDDFGTGYSSLSYFKRLPAHVIKIDRSFISNLLDDTEDMAIVEGILELATTFKRQIIAEGVESVEHGIILLLLGCEIGQGYAIAKPMSAQKIQQWIKRWKPPKEWLKYSKLNKNDDISLLYAIVEHRKWMKLAINYVLEKESKIPQLDSKKCMFGKWLQHFNHDPLQYDPFIQLHNALHEKVDTLISLKNRHNNDLVKKGIDELKQMGDDFVEKLFQMIMDQISTT